MAHPGLDAGFTDGGAELVRYFDQAASAASDDEFFLKLFQFGNADLRLARKEKVFPLLKAILPVQLLLY